MEQKTLNVEGYANNCLSGYRKMEKNVLIVLSVLVFFYVTNMLGLSTTLLWSEWGVCMCVCGVMYVFMHVQVEYLPKMGTRLIVPKTPFLTPTPV